MQNKDKGDGIEDSPLDMLLVILLEGASKEVVTPSSYAPLFQLENKAKLKPINWLSQNTIWSTNFTKHWALI